MKFAKLFLVAMALAPAAPLEVAAYAPEKAGFSLTVRGESIDYKVFGLYVLPKEKISIEARTAPGAEGAAFDLEAAAGTTARPGPARWTWQAPAAKGLYPMKVVRKGTGEEIRLNVFVMLPMSRVKDGKLNGYLIGRYPAKPLRGLAIYKAPRGFVEVTQENADTAIAPHFTLRQFVCKQEGGYPKYVALRELLLLKLEYLLQAVNEKGIKTDTFFVMSGFRTPAYNAAIGNVKYSRHMWGGAADIFVDEDRDGVMDDINGDGRVDKADATFLYDFFETLGGKPSEYDRFEGGLGLYDATPAHGPFVHVDARGFKARWGK